MTAAMTVRPWRVPLRPAPARLLLLLPLAPLPVVLA
jgi:hypothetical protein